MSPWSTLPVPTTPSTVRVAPDDRWTSMPNSTSRAITASICSSVARSFMTTTMALPLVGGDSFRPPCFVDDAFENPDGRFRFERPRQLRGGGPNELDHFLLALGIVDGHRGIVLETADLDRARDTDVQQANE